MTEEVPITSSILECNGNVPPEKTQLQVIDIIDEIAKSVGTVPCENAETSPEAPLKKENQEDNKYSVEDNTICGALDGEKQCEGKVQYCFFSICSGRKPSPLFYIQHNE